LTGKTCGLGLFEHYRNLQRYLWPWKDWHRWNNLLLEQFIFNRIVGVMGPASSGKTHEGAAYALCTYFCFPDNTTVMASSTDSRSLELRIWGELKKLWATAADQWPDRPGHLIGSKQMITTDGKDSEARDFRNGLVGIPCVQSGNFVGLGKYVGVKNMRVILLADEAQFMAASFFDAIANLNKNRGFQGFAFGNPKDRTDILGRVCEPDESIGGWDGLDNTEKTKTWRNRFKRGVTVQLVGTDSPNFDVPEDAPIPYPYLIKRDDIAQDEKFYGRDSLQFSMMNLGMMPKDAQSRRVITRTLCEKFGAREEPIWDGEIKFKVLFLDAAYGNIGGDRCVMGELWCGKDRSGKTILAFIGNPIVVPVKGGKENGTPEDQIAAFAKTYAAQREIGPESFFFDSTGRGTLMSSLSRLWSPSVNAVEFGGPATERPVSNELKMTCREHFSKLVTELWFAVRYTIEAGQFRGLPEDVMMEGCMREWKIVRGNKVEIEPKDKTKIRMGRSPDLFDALVVGVEGARRKGFTISKTGKAGGTNSQWLRDLFERNRLFHRSKDLKYAA
jgi:hypothetical protein